MLTSFCHLFNLPFYSSLLVISRVSKRVLWLFDWLRRFTWDSLTRRSSVRGSRVTVSMMLISWQWRLALMSRRHPPLQPPPRLVS